MLNDVFEFVKADFRTSGCPARVLFGEKFKAENAEPNRVVFVPRTDGEYVAPIPSVHGAVYQARSMMTRNAGCDVWIWGAANKNDLGEQQLPADYAVLNALINQTALSLYRACGLGRVLTITGGQHDVNALLVNRGLAYTMKIRVAIPILDIDFPCGCIDENVFTWLRESDVTGAGTVEMRESIPTGTLMSSVSFSVTGE